MDTRTACIAAGAAAAGFIAGYLLLRPSTEPAPPTAPPPDPARLRLAHRAAQAADPALLAEQLSRNRLYFGEAGQARLAGAFVVVVGLGGVGSHAAHMLARAGVARLRLVDFDNVTLSSLNRHAVATRDDVGRPKVAVCAEHFRDIVPGCQVEPLAAMFTADDAEVVLGGRPDIVIDAIDDLNSKADLLLACHARGLRVISSLGAAAKADPTRLRIGNMTDPVKDPLIVKLRWCLRKRIQKQAAASSSEKQQYAELQKLFDTTRVIYSCEEAQAKLADLTEEQAENPSAFGALANFRLRVLPVLGTMPALVGIGAAAWVLSELGQKPFVPQRAEPVSQKIAHRLHNKLVQRETQVYGNDHAASPIADQNEVSHVLEDVWGLRSAFSGSRNLSHLMTLTRFDRSKPALPYNLVVVTEPEAEWLEAETAATGSLPRALMGDGTSDAGSPSKVAPALETLLAIGDTLGRLEAVWTAEEVRSQTERKARLAKFNSARRK